MSMNVNQKPQHPGKITFIDDAKKETVQDASTVPESVRFAKDKSGGWQPVVRVVASTAGDQRSIREYGQDGMLLRSTVQVKKPDLSGTGR